MPLKSTAAERTLRLKQKLTGESALMPTAPSVVGRLHTALSALRQGETVQPEAIFRDILASAPQNPDALHGLGLILLQRGETKDAIGLLKRALKTGKAPGQFHVNLAVALETDGQIENALKTLKKAVSQDGDDPFLHQSLGVFLFNRSRDKDALHALEKAARLNPELPRLQLMLGDIHIKNQRDDLALECYKRHVEQNPEDRRILSRVAYLLANQGKHQEILDRLLPLYEDGTTDGDLCNNIGSALIHLDRLDDAEPYILKAYELDPSRWEFNANVAGLHMANERLDAAVTLFERLKEQYPDNPQPATDLALIYIRMGRVEDARRELEAITEAHPEHDPAWVALGMLNMTETRYYDAADAYRKAIEVNPINVHANSNLSIVLKPLNELDEASFYANKTIHLPGFSPAFFSNAFQVFHATCDFDGISQLGDLRELVDNVADNALPGCVFDLMRYAEDLETSRWVASVNRRWGLVLEESAARNPLPPMPTWAKHDKVRVGFLSSDLRDHSVGKHITPLMENFDSERLEVYGYSAWNAEGDRVHEALAQRMNGGIRNVSNLMARDVAAVIRADEIDILFELNGHTMGARLDVVPYRPAPVQIEWLGFPFTTGLKDLDYFLLDEHVAPADLSLMLEKPLMMPESWTIFGGYPDMPITGTLPVEENGYITFGSLNAPYKMTRPTIEAWSRVMLQVPNSRMMIVRPDVKSRILCANIANEFNNCGINPERIGFFDNRSNKINFQNCYNFIDMTMDTMPVTGGTTTCDAMWMGVPVVTLAGPSYHQRISHALLSHIGLQELSTTSLDEFVQRSVDLAGDIDSLRFLRRNLRTILRESYLCDGPRYATHFCDVMEKVAREHGLA